MARALMWTLALALLAWAVWLWPDVPGRVPVHFGLNGEPNAWADRSAWSWFGLPAVGLAIAAGVDVLLRWSLSRPGAPGINLPQKETVLALPPERQAPVWDRVAAMVYAGIALSLGALALIQVGGWAESQGADGSRWVLAGVVTAVVAPLAMLTVGMVRVDAEVKRQRLAADAAG